MSFRNNLVKKFVRKKFDRTRFMHEDECAICLGQFIEDEEVTPLPCDMRHFFHSRCI